MRRLNLTDLLLDNEIKIEKMFAELFEVSGLQKYAESDKDKLSYLIHGKLMYSVLDNLIALNTGAKNGIELHINFSDSISDYANSVEDILDIIDCLSVLTEEAEKYEDISVHSKILYRWKFTSFVYKNIRERYPDAILSFLGGSIILPSLNYFSIYFDSIEQRESMLFNEINGLQIMATTKQYKESVGDITIINKIHSYILKSMFSDYTSNMYDEMIEEFLLDTVGENLVDDEKVISDILSVIPGDIFEIAATSYSYKEPYSTNRSYFKYRDKYYYYTKKNEFKVWETREQLIADIEGFA